MAYVDNGRGYSEGGEGQASSSAAQEAAIQVEGSYGTKVTTTPHSLSMFMAKASSCAFHSKTLCCSIISSSTSSSNSSSYKTELMDFTQRLDSAHLAMANSRQQQGFIVCPRVPHVGFNADHMVLTNTSRIAACPR